MANLQGSTRVAGYPIIHVGNFESYLGDAFSSIKYDMNMNNYQISGIRKLEGTFGNIASSYDEWLRFNEGGTHSNGAYFASGVVRFDGSIQVGASGATLNVVSGGDFNYKSGALFGQFSTGYVGVGIVAPQAPLNTFKTPVAGTFVEQIRVGGTNNYQSLSLGIFGLYDGYISTFGDNLHILAGKGVTSEDHNIKFYTSFNGVDGEAEKNLRMVIEHDGRVGIGLASPAELLDVNGNINVTGNVKFNDVSRYWLLTATNWGIYWDTAENQIQFHGAGVSRFYVDLDNGDTYTLGKATIDGSIYSKSFIHLDDANGLGLVGNYKAKSTASKIIWTLGTDHNTLATHYGLGYEYGNSIDGSTNKHEIVIRHGGTTNIRLGTDGNARFNGAITSPKFKSGNFEIYHDATDDSLNFDYIG